MAISDSKCSYFVFTGCVLTGHFNSNKLSSFVTCITINYTAISSHNGMSETIISWELKIVRIILHIIVFTY